MHNPKTISGSVHEKTKQNKTKTALKICIVLLKYTEANSVINTCVLKRQQNKTMCSVILEVFFPLV